jgi:hypothetical protein
MLARCINGQVQVSLPQVGVLSDGRTVSRYDLLPMDELTAEGWLLFEQIMPTYDENTQYLMYDRYEVQADKIVEYFTVISQ